MCVCVVRAGDLLFHRLYVCNVSSFIKFPIPMFQLFHSHSRGADCEERKRPVIVHRAMLGSVERMVAILTESFGGKW